MGDIAKLTPRRNSVIGGDALNASSMSVIVSSATYRKACLRPLLLSIYPSRRGATSARRARVSLRDERALHHVELFKGLAGTARDARQRIVGDVHWHLRCFADASIEAL